MVKAGYFFLILLVCFLYHGDRCETNPNAGKGMNILCITHADFQIPGIIESWALNAGHQLIICRPYKGDTCLDIDFDFLIIRGGPQNSLELEKAPYLKDEITLISRAIEQKKTVLGICLGAQLISEAFGSRCTLSPEKEVGVFPIKLTIAGTQDPLFVGFPQSFLAVHWHYYMPGEIKQTKAKRPILLATSAGCPRQIIRYAPKVYGFQCHLELTLEGAKQLINSFPEDLEPGKFVQTVDELLKNDYTTINTMMITILNRLAELRT